jgi:hypothetical protein
MPTQPLFPVLPAGGLVPLPDELDTPVMPAMLGELVHADAAEPPLDTSEPRMRAAALPPGPPRKSPTLPPPLTLPGLRPPGTSHAPGAPASPPQPADAEDWADEPRGEDAHARSDNRSSGLAARVDAALRDEWSMDTPVVPPPPEDLRALLGVPDPTRQQSIDELEALHRATEDLPSEELFVSRRPPHPTSEVDPDQIEAAIEIAPPARRVPSAAVIIKPKKPK